MERNSNGFCQNQVAPRRIKTHTHTHTHAEVTVSFYARLRECAPHYTREKWLNQGASAVAAEAFIECWFSVCQILRLDIL